MNREDRNQLQSSVESNQRRLGINPNTGPQTIGGIIEARPTLFDGVLLRTKAEAQTASFLSNVTRDWLYEPEPMRIGRWLPDFVIPQFRNHKEMAYIVIEYKPREPNDQMMEEFRRHVAILNKETGCRFEAFFWWVDWHTQWSSDGGSAALIEGEWHKFYPFRDIPLFGPGTRPCDNAGWFEQAKRMRFDLK